MPAKLGEDVQLRCTKVLAKSNYVDTAACTDVSNSTWGCGHRWYKSFGKNKGRAISKVNNKYSFTETVTKGYCATFDDTKANFESLNFTSSKDSEFKCLVSTMTIKTVTLSDFGGYMCNFSDHGTKYTPYGRDPTYDLSEVVQSGTKKQPQKVVHQELHYQGKKDELVIQCVVTGGKVKWMIKPFYVYNSSDYYLYSDYCSYNGTYDSCTDRYVTIDQLKTTDYWRCFDISVVYANPYQDVSESLIGVKNTCNSDMDIIVCTVDGYAQKNNYNSLQITKEHESSNKGYWYWSARETAVLTSVINTPILFGLLLISFSIWAAVRGCKRKRNNYTLTVLPQQQQLIIPPQPQVNYTPQPVFYQQHPGFNPHPPQLTELSQPVVATAPGHIYETIDGAPGQT